MNYKLYALILTLTLSATPAMQAMRATRSLVATARTLRPAAIPTGKHALAQTHSTRNNGYGYYQEKARHTYDNYSIPAATAIAVGVGLGAQDALEQEEDYSAAIHNLDITDIKAVLEVFKNGSEDDKRELAQRIAKKITSYSVYDIIAMLRQTDKRPHRILINAVTKNIFHYSFYDIRNIIDSDRQDDTHELIAAALKKNYDELIGNTTYTQIFGTPHYDNHRGNFIYLIEALKPQYQGSLLHVIAQDITNYRKDELQRILRQDFYYHGVLNKSFNAEDQAIISSAIADNIDKFDTNSIMAILKITSRNNQNIITAAMANNVQKYGYRNMPRIFKYANEQSKEVISATIANNLNKFSDKELLNILRHSYGQHKEVISTAMVNNIDMNTRYSSTLLERMLYASNEKIQAIIAAHIVLHVDSYTQDDLRRLLRVSNESTKATIFKAMYNKIDVLIDQHTVDSQSAAHLKNNIFEAWEYIATIANNPKYKAAFEKAARYEHSVANDSAVFYHSQKSAVYWLELLYTKLWEQKYNQKSENYLFTRFPRDTSEFSNAALQHDGQLIRNALLSNGRAEGQDALRPYLLFTNYALFGNATNWGSCSAHYFIKNFNIGDPDITTKTIIDSFGDTTLFNKYESEFKRIEHEFKEIVSSSVLLQFIIPSKALNDHVYLAAPGGYKKKLEISREEVNNIATIIKTLKTAPKTMDNTDQQEFCIIMTPDTVHTLREQGTEVRVYGGFDQEKLNALTAKLEALIARVAKENPNVFKEQLTPTESCHKFGYVLDQISKPKDY